MKKQVGMDMVKIQSKYIKYIYIKLKCVFDQCFSNIFTLLHHFLLLIFIFVCVSTGVYMTQPVWRSEVTLHVYSCLLLGHIKMA